jgi:hypothetical protein
MTVFWLFSLQKRGCLFTFSSPCHVIQNAHMEWFALDFMGQKSANFRGRGGRVAFLPTPSRAFGTVPDALHDCLPRFPNSIVSQNRLILRKPEGWDEGANWLNGADLAEKAASAVYN